MRRLLLPGNNVVRTGKDIITSRITRRYLPGATILAERPNNHSLTKRLRSGAAGCTVRVGRDLVVVIPINSNVIHPRSRKGGVWVFPPYIIINSSVGNAALCSASDLTRRQKYNLPCVKCIGRDGAKGIYHCAVVSCEG